MTYISEALYQLVSERAQGCCEYCWLHQDDAFLPHEIDHIIAVKHRGETHPDNLCLSCFDCNRFKGSDISSLDIDTKALTPLFNPRSDSWADHFRIKDAFVEPLTAIGRVTVYLLQINRSEQVEKRRELIELKRYPCTLKE